MRPPIKTPPSAPDVTDSPATLPVVRISAWLDCVCGSKPTIRSETGVYIAECNGMGCTVPMIMALSSEQLQNNWNAWMERAQSNAGTHAPATKKL